MPVNYEKGLIDLLLILVTKWGTLTKVTFLESLRKLPITPQVLIEGFINEFRGKRIEEHIT